jgi:hypothetical protein
MKKINTAAVKQTNNFAEQKLTIGLDLGDRSSWLWAARLKSCPSQKLAGSEVFRHG